MVRSRVERWKLSFNEAFDIGLNRLNDCTTAKFLQEGRYFIGTWDDVYASSRFLIPEIFRSLVREIPGHRVYRSSLLRAQRHSFQILFGLGESLTINVVHGLGGELLDELKPAHDQRQIIFGGIAWIEKSFLVEIFD